VKGGPPGGIDIEQVEGLLDVLNYADDDIMRLGDVAARKRHDLDERLPPCRIAHYAREETLPDAVGPGPRLETPVGDLVARKN